MTARKRIKLTFDVPDKIRRALAAYAGSENLTVGEVIERLVSEHLAEFVTIAEKAIAKGDEPESRRRGKPKSD